MALVLRNVARLPVVMEESMSAELSVLIAVLVLIPIYFVCGL